MLMLTDHCVDFMKYMSQPAKWIDSDSNETSKADANAQKNMEDRLGKRKEVRHTSVLALKYIIYWILCIAGGAGSTASIVLHTRHTSFRE